MPADLEAATAACRTGVLVDWTARSVLWGKGENKPVPVASLTKMMTVLLLMEDVASRSDLDLDTRIAVTKEAAAIGGRQVWLDPRETFSVEDLLRCVLIHSGNDAAYLVAQTLEGSEAAFVERMNRRARELGLTTAKFLNSHGLPDEATRQENVASAIELAFLAGQLLDYPAVVERSGTRLSFLEPRIDGKKTQLLNTNKLVGRVAGVNGMKTGYTNNSGYCLTATCERNRRQAVVVVTGCDRGTARDDLAAKLLEWLYATP
ncbi:MAG: D-alanyl-D-alanine carboxypeptidase [Lentisphaeria bacterium]|nr:D-alanyl-D-alanine carboxypeptidase [Lentisphaeria bacterium]